MRYWATRERGGKGQNPRANLSKSRLTLRNLNCREFLALDTHLIKIPVYFHKKQISVDNSLKPVLSGSNVFPVTQEVGHAIAGLHVTSRRPCWWSRTKAFLSSALGSKLYFHVNSSRKYSFVLTPNMADLSRGCKPRISNNQQVECLSFLYLRVFHDVTYLRMKSLLSVILCYCAQSTQDLKLNTNTRKKTMSRHHCRLRFAKLLEGLHSALGRE